MHIGVRKEVAPLRVQLSLEKPGAGLEAKKAEQAEHPVPAVSPRSVSWPVCTFRITMRSSTSWPSPPTSSTTEWGRKRSLGF